MPAPVAFAIGYLAVNFSLMVWLVREEAAGRMPPPAVAIVAPLLRYGPPLAGLLYLVTIAGDWPFFLFVVTFFGVGFGLLSGLPSTPIRPPRK
jgi:hypothetical protein